MAGALVFFALLQTFSFRQPRLLADDGRAMPKALSEPTWAEFFIGALWTPPLLLDPSTQGIYLKRDRGNHAVGVNLGSMKFGHSS